MGVGVVSGQGTEQGYTKLPEEPREEETDVMTRLLPTPLTFKEMPCVL